MLAGMPGAAHVHARASAHMRRNQRMLRACTHSCKRAQVDVHACAVTCYHPHAFTCIGADCDGLPHKRGSQSGGLQAAA